MRENLRDECVIVAALFSTFKIDDYGGAGAIENEHHFGADEHNCNLWMIEIEKFYLNFFVYFDNENLCVGGSFRDLKIFLEA